MWKKYILLMYSHLSKVIISYYTISATYVQMPCVQRQLSTTQTLLWIWGPDSSNYEEYRLLRCGAI
jgi:hypothetical protein